jgi:hypothetical protein
MMMKFKSSLLMTVLGCALVSGVQAQSCHDGLTETTIIDNFTLLSNGLAQDKTTGLMWMRCAYGQTWDSVNSTCTGNAVELTWQDALQASEQMTEGGYTDWRLPNVKELATIVEKRCTDPAVNATLFPATPADNFWTSTTVTGSGSWAWSVAFYNGRNNTKEKLLDVHARFVRFAQ